MKRLVRPFVSLASMLVMCGAMAGTAAGQPTIPALWTAGGLTAGIDSDGESARLAVDPSGNIAIVSGPAESRLLAVTSYTPDGTLRWQRTVAPTGVGTFRGDWVAAAPDGDVVAIGRTFSSSGSPLAMTMVRYGADGTLRWRKDVPGLAPSVGRLLVDGAGDAYLAFNAVGDGQDIALQKYSASGALLWSRVISTGPLANDIATSLTLSPDGADVALSGEISGGATWITANYNAATGARRWLVTAAEGVLARDLVMDDARVYVTGQGNVGIQAFLTVVAYDRSTGARLWRTDRRPPGGTNAAGLRIARAPDGSVVATGQGALQWFLDWYTVAFETSGDVRWEALRDGGMNWHEIPRGVLVMADGTTVVTGPGGPNLPGGFIQGVTAGYSPEGILLWQAFSRMATSWVADLPNGDDVCATGGYDAFITCFRVSGAPAPPPLPAPAGLTARALTPRSIRLNWKTASTDQTEVRIERCEGSGCTTFSEVAAVAGAVSTFNDSGLTPRTTYRYRVRGFRPQGFSPYSNVVAARTPTR